MVVAVGDGTALSRKVCVLELLFVDLMQAPEVILEDTLTPAAISVTDTAPDGIPAPSHTQASYISYPADSGASITVVVSVRADGSTGGYHCVCLLTGCVNSLCGVLWCAVVWFESVQPIQG